MSITQRTFAQTALFLATIALMEVALAAPILPDERLCSELWAELASAPEPGRSADYREYMRAASAQREQIMIARRQARDIGCGFYTHAGRPACAPINAKIEKMERNLVSLEHRRAELAREEGQRQSRSRILAALNANDCGDRRLSIPEETPHPAAQERIATPVEQKRESPPVVIQPRPTSVQENLGASASRHDSGGNMPVRSFTIIAGNPPADEPLANPLAAEPPIDTDNPVPLGTETASPGQDRHAVLPDRQNAPSPSVLDLVPAAEPGILAAPAQTDTAAGPAPYEQPAQTEEELPAGPPPSPEAAPHDPGQRKVRVVGPTFLPDPEGAINLRAPVRNQAR